MSRSRIYAAILVVVVFFATVAPARAGLVSWDIDSAASYVRLTIPDQNITIGSYTINARIRDQNSASWSDAGGRRAFLEGTVETNLDIFGGGLSSLNYLGGNTARAIDDKNLRPNPASWNGTTFTETSSAPAAFGGMLRGNFLAQNFDAGFFSFSDIGFDIAGGGPLSTFAIPGGGSYPFPPGYSLPGNSTTFGIGDGTLAIDGVSSLLPVQALADQLIDAPPLSSANAGATTITHVVGFLWKLTYTVNQPIEILVAEDGYLTGTANGQIVAYALLIPEPSSVVMAGVACVGLGWAGRRRLRRRKIRHS